MPTAGNVELTFLINHLVILATTNSIYTAFDAQNIYVFIVMIKKIKIKINAINVTSENNFVFVSSICNNLKLIKNALNASLLIRIKLFFAILSVAIFYVKIAG